MKIELSRLSGSRGDKLAGGQWFSLTVSSVETVR